jgi:hypothetical protein
MPILLVEQRVPDFDAWKAAFDSDPVGREEGGVRRYRISRPIDDPNLVFVALEFDGSDEAEAFRGKLRALWSRIESEGLVEGPQASILEVVEAKEY